MTWRVAQSLETLRHQLNEAFPNRSKKSDGGIGDAKHASRSSDHNPWVQYKGQGIVTARDFTHDPKDGIDCQWLADVLVKNKDSRIKYIIWNRRILSSKTSPWKWRPYTGVNGHTHHLHISVDAEPKRFDSVTPWDLDLEDDVARVYEDLDDLKDGVHLDNTSPATPPIPVNAVSNLQDPAVQGTPGNSLAIESKDEQPGSTQIAEQIINTGDVPANFTPETVAITAPPATGFMGKLKAQGAALLATIGGFAGLKEWFGIQLSDETAGLLKILLPTVLGLGFIGFLFWYVTEKVVGYQTMKLKATLRSDPTKHNPVIIPADETSRWRFW